VGHKTVLYDMNGSATVRFERVGLDAPPPWVWRCSRLSLTAPRAARSMDIDMTTVVIDLLCGDAHSSFEELAAFFSAAARGEPPAHAAELGRDAPHTPCA